MKRGGPVGFAVGIAPNLVGHPALSDRPIRSTAPTKDLVLLEDEV